jgi:hypothetical protein
MVMVSDYFNLFYRLKNFSFERPMGSFYVALVSAGERLNEKGIKLTGEESDMLQFIKDNLVESTTAMPRGICHNHTVRC